MVDRKWILLMLSALSLSSCCPPTSTHSLSSPDEAEYDERLGGTWIHESKSGDIGFLHIGKAEGNLTRAIAVETAGSGKLEHTVFTLFPTRLDSGRYLNVEAGAFLENHAREPSGYLIVRYELSGRNELSVFSMGKDPLEKAIRSGELKGEITYRKRGTSKPYEAGRDPESDKVVDCIRITDSPERIIRFIARKPAQTLFPDEIRLRRMDLKE